jgi:two-component system sensor histidine kinase BaeS
VRSISAKFTLAFLVVGLAITLMVLANLFIQVRSAFNQFVFNQYQQNVVKVMVDYYQAHGSSWEGIAGQMPALLNLPPANLGIVQVIPEGSIPYTLVGADRKVVISTAGETVGQGVANFELEHAIELKSSGQTVGWLSLTFFTHDSSPNSPEGAFFNSVNRAILNSALGSLLIAVLLGGLLAFTMTRSLRELTEATDEMARGKLGQQVKIRSRDELGRLAESFNKMSRETARAAEMRLQMTADIAHDLRNPLSILSGYTETLSDGSLDPSPEVFSAMYQETRHLSRLVDDLRTLSLADAGELALYPEPVNPADFLAQVAARHALKAAQQGVSIQVEAAAGLPAMRVDPARFAQVFDNLVINALRYTEGGRITLSASLSGQTLQLTIADHGSGIAPEDLTRIFDRFYRGDPARPQNGESGRLYHHPAISVIS